jgi:hypothetical protein
MARPANPLKALILNVKIRGVRVRILIDSGCLNNFMSPDFVKKTQLHIQAKGYQYIFYGIDNQFMAENGGTVAKEITLIPVDILDYWERVNFNVIRTSTYDAVLGLPWLEKHNLTINYRERTLTFDGCGCKPVKDVDINEVLMRAMNAYYR